MPRPINGIDAVLVPIGGGLYDIQFDFAGDIETDDFFDTAILVSFFADRRASASEVPEPQRRRGWIGSESSPGVKRHSKIWLFEQSRVTRTSLAALANAVRDSILWLVEDGHASEIRDVRTFSTPTQVMAEATIEHKTGETETKLFELWSRTGISG